MDGIGAMIGMGFLFIPMKLSFSIVSVNL